MAVVLVTGMSGVGKSTVLDRLARLGYRTVDTDAGDWIECVDAERLWRVDRIDSLLSEHERTGEPLFVSGTVRNQGAFAHRFDAVVLLSAPLPVLLDRIARRDTNPFGKSGVERARIIADTRAIEPLLRASATVEIQTTQPLAAVVDQLVALAGPPPAR